MKLLASFIVSLHLLVTHPVSWFTKRNWLIRLALVALIIPLISLITIQYQSYLPIDVSSTMEVSTLEDRLTALEEENKQLHREQASQLDTITSLLESLTNSPQLDMTATAPAVLGVGFGEREELALTKDNLLFIPQQLGPLSVHVAPDAASPKLIEIRGDAFFYFVATENDWYQITVDGNLTGWIQHEELVVIP